MKTGLVSRNILSFLWISQKEPRSCFLRRALAAVPQQWHLWLQATTHGDLQIYKYFCLLPPTLPSTEILVTKLYRWCVEADDLFPFLEGETISMELRIALFSSEVGERAQESALGPVLDRIWIISVYLITLGWSRQFLTASRTPVLMHWFPFNRILLSKDSAPVESTPSILTHPKTVPFSWPYSFLVGYVKQRQTSLFCEFFMILPS